MPDTRDTRARLDLDRLIAIVSSDENIGICTACGAEHGGIEPDARGDVCDECRLPAVYGAEELLLTADLRR